MYLARDAGDRLPAHHLDSQDRQRLPNVVMQFASNAGSLVLLRCRKPLRHLMPRRLGRAQVR
jgi:hypothetical protein